MAFKTILCATDLSEGSAVAVQEAFGLARSHGARLELLLVGPTPPPAMVDPLRNPAPYSEMLRAEAASMEALRASVSELIGEAGSAPDLRVEQGSPEDVIVERAQDLGADLIVVGARGGSTSPTAMLGTIADHVLRHARSSVLVARACTLRGAVLAATDFSESAQRAVRVAADEARRLGVWLTVLHSVAVFEEAFVAAGVPVPSVPPPPGAPSLPARVELQRQAQGRLEAMCGELGVPCDAAVTEWDPVQDILQTADRKSAQRIVMGRVGRTGLERLLLGSVTEDVARRARCSVLAVA